MTKTSFPFPTVHWNVSTHKLPSTATHHVCSPPLFFDSIRNCNFPGVVAPKSSQLCPASNRRLTYSIPGRVRAAPARGLNLYLAGVFCYTQFNHSPCSQPQQYVVHNRDRQRDEYPPNDPEKDRNDQILFQSELEFRKPSEIKSFIMLN